MEGTTTPKIAQPHGGSLNAHGTVGNRGGTGRPPSEVRRIAREMLAARLPVLDEIAAGRVVVPVTERCPKCGHIPTPDEVPRKAAIERAPKPAEQVRAIEALARVGMSGNVTVDDLKARVIAQVRETREWGKEHGIGSGLIEQLLDRHHSVWRL
jgi:hypothetical protein